MIVLSESTDRLPPSQSRRDLDAATETARLLGIQVVGLEPDFERCEDAEGALAHLRPQSSLVPAVWIGYIPTRERYTAVYAAALQRNVRLINDPDEFARAMEFSGFYSRLHGLTPESMVLEQRADCEAAVKRLGLPLFLKGSVQSNKSDGWKACVAETLPQLQNRWRTGLIARKVVPLRHSRYSAEGFPFGREYRVFILRGEVLGSSYYWEGDDPLKHLSASEQEQVESLAREAARRLDVPYVAIDVGQAESGEWVVIETGDAQFCGVCGIPRIQLWTRLLEAV